MFRYSRSRFNSGSARIITVEVVVALYQPEFKTKVSTALDKKRVSVPINLLDKILALTRPIG